MRRRWLTVDWFVIGALAVVGCGDDANDISEPRSRSDASTPATRDAGPADAGYSCTPPPSCPDLEVADQSSRACCSPVTECGYELPEVDDETLMLFPGVIEARKTLTAGDPRGICAPESFFFGPRPALYDHRVLVEDGDDILLTEQCESYTLLAFILPGCCLPDNACGLSTDESYATFADFAPGLEAPFTKPECVSAETLNQQFRDSVVLEDFARTTATGRCNYAELDATLEP